MARIKPLRDISDSLIPKWERHIPGRFRFEMRVLEQVVGETLRVDEGALAAGVLITQFDWPLEGQTTPLEAIYPDSFPRLRPLVKLRGDRAGFPQRHCSPIDGNLCLLGRDSRQWRQQWTLRRLLEEQLADALRGTGDEDQQGEPAEYWWNGLGRRGSYCLIDSSWTLNEATSGTLHIRYRFRKVDGDPEIKAIITEVRNQDGTTIQRRNSPIPLSPGRESLTTTIPWAYIDEVLLPNGTREQLYELTGRLRSPPRRLELGAAMTGEWFAIVHKSELGPRTFGLGWLFPLFHGSSKAFRRPKPGQQRISRPGITLIPTYRAGEQDLGARVPAFRSLRDKKIAIIGLGAVGAPLVIELARNGCSRLHLIDHDVVEPGNSIRWPLGTTSWGRQKTDSLSEFIRQEYPWTDVREQNHTVGGFKNDRPHEGDEEIFTPILSDVNLVVDASTSYGVSTLLSDYCRARSIPLISLYASPLVEGGVVARFMPNSGCPTCLEFAYEAGTLVRAPGFSEDDADDGRGLQQPPGCAERTFTGASYDLQEISLQAIRLIVETLSNPAAAHGSVIHTLSLAEDGRRIPPAWRVEDLPRAEGCSCAKTP